MAKISNFQFQITNFKWVKALEIVNCKFEIGNSWRSQVGVSSMMVLVLVCLILFIAWEISQFTKQFIRTGAGNAAAPAGTSLDSKDCVGSNTAFDCYDQDEGTDFVDN